MKKIEDCGAGEIFLTSINKEGTKEGFDIELTNKVSNIVKIPVVAHGGGGSFQQVYDVIRKTNISGVSLAGLFHYDICSLFKLKKKSVGNTHFLDNLKKKTSSNFLKGLKQFLYNKGVNLRKWKKKLE